MQPEPMVAVFSGKKYDTATATLIAGDDYHDGRNWERRGRNTFLYRTKNGRYFLQHRTQWQGERDRLEPIDDIQAAGMWESLPEQRCSYDEAFPNAPAEDA